MQEPDLTLLTTAAREAGRIARTFFDGSNEVWDKGHDDPVSEADLAVDTYLRETLTAARPSYGWLSEETEDSGDRLNRHRLFVVDPIDGTRAFLAGESTWAHSLAVVEGRQAIAGAVFLPIKDRMFAASRNGGATLNGAPISVSKKARAEHAHVLASRPALDPRHWPGGVPPISRHFRPSLAYRLSLVGEGRFDGMFTLRDSWEWDIAAGALIAEEAGARVSDRTGADLKFNNAHPVTSGVFAAAPGVHEDLMSHLLDPDQDFGRSS